MRAIYNHTYVVDTTKAVHVWEHDGYPQFYIPASEFRNVQLRDKETIRKDDDVVIGAVVELTVPAKGDIPEAKTDRVIRFANDDRLGALKDLVRIEFGAMGSSLSLSHCLSRRGVNFSNL